jgi:hypothetical protein
MMNLERFGALAQAFGGDPARWPPAHRDAACELALADPQAQMLLAQAASLDALLDEAPAQPASLALRTRLAEAAQDLAPSRRRLSWVAGLGLGAILAASCAAGAVTGVAAATRQIEPTHATVTDPAADAARFLDEPSDPSEG